MSECITVIVDLFYGRVCFPFALWGNCSFLQKKKDTILEKEFVGVNNLVLNLIICIRIKLSFLFLFSPLLPPPSGKIKNNLCFFPPFFHLRGKWRHGESKLWGIGGGETVVCLCVCTGVVCVYKIKQKQKNKGACESGFSHGSVTHLGGSR